MVHHCCPTAQPASQPARVCEISQKAMKCHGLLWNLTIPGWLAGWAVGHQWCCTTAAPLLHHCCRLAGWLAGWPPPHSGFPNNLWFGGIFLLKVFLKPTSEHFESKILKNAPFVSIIWGFWKNIFSELSEHGLTEVVKMGVKAQKLTC